MGGGTSSVARSKGTEKRHIEVPTISCENCCREQPTIFSSTDLLQSLSVFLDPASLCCLLKTCKLLYPMGNHPDVWKCVVAQDQSLFGAWQQWQKQPSRETKRAFLWLLMSCISREFYANQLLLLQTTENIEAKESTKFWTPDPWSVYFEDTKKKTKLARTPLQPEGSFRYLGSNDYSTVEPARLFKSAINSEHAACISSETVSWYSLSQLPRAFESNSKKIPEIKHVYQIPAHNSVSFAFDINKTSTLSVSNQDSTIIVFAGPNNDKLCRPESKTHPVILTLDDEFHLNSRFLREADDKIVVASRSPKIWDLSTQSIAVQFHKPDDGDIDDVCQSFSNYNYFLLSTDQRIELLDARIPTSPVWHTFTTKSCHSLSWHSEHTFVAMSESEAAIYDIRHNSELFKEQIPEVEYFAFNTTSSFGNYFFYSDTGKVILFDPFTRQQVNLFRGYDNIPMRYISSLNMNSNDILAASSHDSRIYFFAP